VGGWFVVLLGGRLAQQKPKVVSQQPVRGGAVTSSVGLLP